MLLALRSLYEAAAGGITRVDTTATTTATNATSITPAAPVGVQSGDFIIVRASISKASTTWASSTYSGWTTEYETVEGALTQQILTRFADGSPTDNPPQMDLTATQTAGMIATAAAYRGVDPANPYVAVAAPVGAPSTQTVHPAAGLTNTDDHAWGVYAGTARQFATNPGITWTPGTGLVEQEDAENGVANSNNVSAIWADTHGPVGTGPVTYDATTSLTTAVSIAWAALLRPAFVGPPTVAAAFSGSGSLTAGGTPAVTLPAALSGSGTLSTTQTPAVTRAADLSGSGTLSAATTPAWTKTAGFSGGGTLTAAGVPGWTRAAAFSGAGTLQASPFGLVIAALSGTGTLSTAQALAVTRAVALSGTGTLTAVARTPAITTAAAFGGVGTLVALAIARTRYSVWTGLLYRPITPHVYWQGSWRSDIPVNLVPNDA